MKCTACGNENANEALFCGACGRKLGIVANAQGAESPLPQYAHAETIEEPTCFPTQSAPTTAEGFREYFKFQRMVTKKEEEVLAARQAATEASIEHEQLSKRWKRCWIAAGVVLMCIISFYTAAFDLSEIPAGGAVCIAIVSALLAFVPFGLMPFIDFSSKHGFFVVFYWPLLIAILCTGIIVAAFIGIPCALSLRGKIKQAEENVSYWNGQTQQLEAQLASIES